jgi:uncharacterized membrane protein YidH (DUF202 family)
MTFKKVVVDIVLPLLLVAALILLSLGSIYLGIAALNKVFEVMDNEFTFINMLKIFFWFALAITLFVIPLGIATIGRAF